MSSLEAVAKDSFFILEETKTCLNPLSFLNHPPIGIVIGSSD